MISERAKKSLNDMVMQGMRSSLTGPDDIVEHLEPVAGIEPLTETEVVMLSVASYQFRLMILIYFSRDEATHAHFARMTRTDPAIFDAQALQDAVAESGNMCCGTFNRELGRAFPHIGMSTPNTINSRCAEHLSLLQYGHLQHFALQLQSGMCFRASLCVTEYQDLDFALEPPAQVESTGELEFF